LDKKGDIEKVLEKKKSVFAKPLYGNTIKGNEQAKAERYSLLGRECRHMQKLEAARNSRSNQRFRRGG